MADLIELDLVVREKGLKQSLTTVERLERQLTKAAKAIDQNRISQDRYNKILLQSKRDYQALGLSSQKATALVRKFAEAQRGATQTTNNLTGAVKQQTQAQMAATKSSNRMGVVTQQAGYQVSDFIVQVQSGTNPFVAFSQQASQLAGVLPLVATQLGLTATAAITLSAALGIAIPIVGAIGAALFVMGGRSNKTAEEVDKLDNKIKSIRSSLEEYADAQRALAAGVTLDEYFLGLGLDQANRELKEAKDNLENLQAAQESVIGSQVKLVGAVMSLLGISEADKYEEALKRVTEAQENLTALEEQQAKRRQANYEEQANAIADTISLMQIERDFGKDSVKYLEAQVTQRMLNYNQQVRSSDLSETQKDILIDLNTQMEEFNLKLGTAAIESERLANNLETAATFRAGGIGGEFANVPTGLDAFGGGGDYRYDLPQTINNTTKAVKKLGNTTKEVMTEAEKAAQAYADALDNTVVSAVGSVSDAWADFVMRGFKDFKGFVGSVLDSFKNMIAQMIAMAAKNRIMLSLGIGGVAPTGAMAGSGLLQGAGILGGGGAGIGAAMSGVGSGISGIMSGGGLGASFANLGGLASGASAGFGAIGAALPAVGVVLAGAAVLKSIFGKKDPIITQEQYEAIKQAGELTGQSINELAIELNEGAGKLSRGTQSIIKSIADMAGGIEEFGEKASFYFANFFSEAEQRAYLSSKALEELNKTFGELGVSVPETHAEYRRLVEAQDLATEAGREMYAGLLNAAEAFVAVKGSVDSVVSSSEALVDKQAREISQNNEMAAAAMELVPMVGGLAGAGRTNIEQYSSRLGLTQEDRQAFIDAATDFAQNMTMLDKVNNILNVSIGEEYISVAKRLRTNAIEIEGVRGQFSDIINTIQDEFGLVVRRGIEGLGRTAGELAKLVPYVEGAGEAMQEVTESVNWFGGYMLNFVSGAGRVAEQVNGFIKDLFGNIGGERGVSSPVDETQTIVQDIQSRLDVFTESISGMNRQYGLAAQGLRNLREQSVQVLAEMGAYKPSEVPESLTALYQELESQIDIMSEAAASTKVKIDRANNFISSVGQSAVEFEQAISDAIVEPIAEGLVQYLPNELQNLNNRIKTALSGLSEGNIQGFSDAYLVLVEEFANQNIAVETFNKTFEVMKEVLAGNVSLTDELTSKQLEGANALQELSDRLNGFLGTVRSGIESLLGITTGTAGGMSVSSSEAYLRSVMGGGAIDEAQLSSAVATLTDISKAQFATEVDYLRTVGRTTELLRQVEATIGGRVPDYGPMNETIGITPYNPSPLIQPNSGNLSGEDVKVELASMRRDLYSGLVQIAKNTRKSADTLNKFDYQGLPNDRGY